MTSSHARSVSEGRSPGNEWLRPVTQTSGLGRYLDILRERWVFAVGTVVVALVVAIAYLALLADTVYQAEADVLVTPIPGDELAIGLPVLRESNDPTRDVETVAKILDDRNVAQRAAAQLDGRVDVKQVLEDVTAAPVAGSNLVTITAEASSAALARDMANAAGEALAAIRTRELNIALERAIERLRETVASLPAEAAAGLGGPSDQLSQLETLRSSGDPSLRLETRAVAPDSPAAPRPLLTVIAALIGGSMLGLAGAFALHAIDPRLKREEQLRELFSVPILARIPREASGGSDKRLLSSHARRWPLGPSDVSPSTVEAYRTLRGMLSASSPHPHRGQSILLTGPSPSEGKTTTAINLAASFAMAGSRVILIESDLRRPAIGETLGVQQRFGFGSAVLGRIRLEDALAPTEAFGDSLRVLLADRSSESMPSEMLALPAAADLLDEATQLADHVIIDSPPLIEVIDALPLARRADDLVMVVRLNATRLPQLNRLGELLAQNDIRPSGFVVVGARGATRSSYYLQPGANRLFAAETAEEEQEARRTWAS